MDRTIRTGMVAAALVAAAAASSATAQITGLPTGGSYEPYESFAQRWYDPGAWYGGGVARAATPGYGPGMYPGPASRLGAASARGFYNQPGMTTPAGEQDQGMPPRPVTAPGSSPLFQGYTPYQGWGDRSRDFYDPYFGGDPSTSGSPSGPGIPETAEDPGVAATVPGAAAARLEAPAAAAPGIGGAAAVPARPGRGVDVENDDLYEDYDSLYGGYGDYDYVERGSLPDPMFGYGPRYRGYYTDDWYGDAAAFDDWYDAVPASGRDRDALGTPGATGSGVPPGLDTPGGPATTTPDSPDPTAPNAPGAGTTGGPGATPGPGVPNAGGSGPGL